MNLNEMLFLSLRAANAENSLWSKQSLPYRRFLFRFLKKTKTKPNTSFAFACFFLSFFLSTVVTSSNFD